MRVCTIINHIVSLCQREMYLCVGGSQKYIERREDGRNREREEQAMIFLFNQKQQQNLEHKNIEGGGSSQEQRK